MRIGVLTGGGDCPGLNAAIRAVVRAATKRGWTVVGFIDGWAGVLRRRTMPLGVANTDEALPIGGTLLGSSRTNPMRKPEEYAKVRAVFADEQLDALVAIGGDDTLSVAAALTRDGHAVVGIPKTIDNDVPETDTCIGFDTAVGVVVDALARLRTTTTSHHRITVVEAMGREAGWLAATGGIAGGADFIMVPERPGKLSDIIAHVQGRRTRGLDYSMIVVSEGAEIEGLQTAEAAVQQADQFGHVTLGSRSVGETLATALGAAVGVEARSSVLGHLQRGGSPTPFDRMLGTRCGVAAVQYIADGKFGVLTALQGGDIHAVPLTAIGGKQRLLDPTYFELLTLFD
ncbi:MAG: ATP-dependent 6-phosphofructokinase [Actinobacteria bacterium]|nr:ATP-dependent 6-phosphofructokinase [Actinomycetota bacterium]